MVLLWEHATLIMSPCVHLKLRLEDVKIIFVEQFKNKCFLNNAFLKQYWRLILIVLLQEHATLCIYQHEIVSPHVFSMFLIPHHTRLFKDAFICVWELGLGQRWWGFSGNFYLSSGCQAGVDSEYVGDLCIYSNPMEILIYGALKNCFEYQYPEKRVVNSIAEFVEGERGG